MAKKVQKKSTESLAEKAVRMLKEADYAGQQVKFAVTRGELSHELVTFRVHGLNLAKGGGVEHSYYELSLGSGVIFMTFEELCRLRDGLVKITKQR